MRVDPTIFNFQSFFFFFSLSFDPSVPDLNGRKGIHNAYYGHVKKKKKKNSTLLIFNLRMRMSQYFHIKTFCLGQGSYFNFSCSHASLVYLVVTQVFLNAFFVGKLIKLA